MATSNISVVVAKSKVEEKKEEPKEQPKQNVVQNTQPKVEYSNREASVDTSSVVNAAYSLLGSSYRYGGTNPDTGFDCSGFVQYVYNAVGQSISRSSSTQINDGVAVERSNIQPGDIVIWSTEANNRPTHASIYVGEDSIIHAINSSRGVQKTGISNWESTGSHIVGIRRI